MTENAFDAWEKSRDGDEDEDDDLKWNGTILMDEWMEFSNFEPNFFLEKEKKMVARQERRSWGRASVENEPFEPDRWDKPRCSEMIREVGTGDTGGASYQRNTDRIDYSACLASLLNANFTGWLKGLVLYRSCPSSFYFYTSPCFRWGSFELLQDYVRD